MRTPGQRASHRLHLRQRDVEAERLQLRDQPHIPLPPHLLQMSKPGAQLLRWRLIGKVPQQMDGNTAIARRYLDPADQFEPRIGRKRDRRVIPREGVVIRDGQRIESHAHRLTYQFRRRKRAVRLVGVAVQVDHAVRINPRRSISRQILSRLCSAVSWSDRIRTSGDTGAS